MKKRNHHTCINDYLDFWINTTITQRTYNNKTNNDQCFISKTLRNVDVDDA